MEYDGNTILLLCAFIATLISLIFILPNSLRSSNKINYSQVINKEIRIQKILIHPVKSCRGSSVQEAKFDESGLQYDRSWLIIDASTKRFQTIRELPKMATIVPKMDLKKNVLEITIPFNDQGKPSIVVNTPLNPTKQELDQMELVENIHIWGVEVDGFAVSKQADDALTEFFKKPVRLVRKGPSLRNSGPDDPRGKESSVNYQDFYPILIATKASIQHVRDTLLASIYPHYATADEKKAAFNLPDNHPASIKSFKVSDKIDKQRWTPEELESFPIERFRPNIVVESFNDDQGKDAKKALIPWEEDSWTHVEIFENDKELGFGKGLVGKGTSIDCVARCGRCLVPNTDPELGVRDNYVPYTIMQKFRQVQPEYAKKGKPCFGILASPAQPSGIVRVGDIVRVTSVMNPDLRVLGH